MAMMVISQLESKLARQPHSPLFARLAGEYFNAGKIEEAKELCISGLRQYPSYATANFVLAKCYASEKNYSLAEKHLQHALVWLPTCASLDTFQKELQAVPNEPRAESPDNVIDTEPSQSSADGYHHSFEDIQTTVSIEEPDGVDTQTIINESQSPPTSIVQSIPVNEEKPTDELNNTLLRKDSTPLNPTESAEKQVFATEESIFRTNEEGRIVSKTLAEIYALQGEYHEAILTYQLLKNQRPYQSQEFDNRINELKTLLHSKTT